ncbi:MAG: hypothetical protein HYX78_04330 [Armatimonadetes bacterium]|nr:hypothetical protein [Armatimonadota bacterium]
MTSPGTVIYRNNGSVLNTPLTAPGGLSAFVGAEGVTLSWSPPKDTETPAAGLSYNLTVGTTPGGSDVFSGMADGSGTLIRVVTVGRHSLATGDFAAVRGILSLGPATITTTYQFVQKIH